MSDFVHLHCHTEYSLLDGAIRLGDLTKKALDYKMPACAITDHGNLYGAVNFYLACKKAGVKPIIGCEVYVAHKALDDRESEFARRRYHLVLLAQNLTGYQNLIKLVSTGHLYGFYHKPRIDKQLLAKHSDGLICLSACLQGEVPFKLRHEGMDAGLAAAREYAAMFPNRYYIELQSNGLDEQVVANEKLIELAGELDLPLVATNDCHYLNQDDVEAHDILLCIQTAKCVDDEKRMRFGTDQLYYKSPQDMQRDFSHVPQALANSVEIAAMCEEDYLDLETYHFPVYELPEGKTLHQEFTDLCRKGLQSRIDKLPYDIDEKVYWERLELEMGIIANMGFEGYFLIVQDFINWAKKQNIPVGPGRGSGAGSIAAWALGVTNLDPIPYNLLFERFLNPERVSMPDFDVDFCERRRIEVIQYVTRKYGDDSVAQITTFGKMKAKAAVRDVGRALGMSFGETDKIAKLIPDELKMTIDKALEMEPELQKLYDESPQVHKLIDVSRRLEGLCRHASTHAAGVVIGDKPLDEYLPLYRGKKDEVVTQFDMKMVEKVGLIKFDFLGLRTMTVVQDALDVIALQGKEVPDLENPSLDDEKTYKEIYAKGDTDGVFQVESDGMRRYLRMLKPTCFDDVIAMLALYRPGPLNSGMVDRFIRRKHGEEPVEYPLPQLEEALQDTYGVIVYQEQVMKIAQIVGNYSLGEADLLRRAMGKKIEEEMAKQRVRFKQGAAENGIPEEKADEIFDLLQEFAKYGFNKSHSAAYALISYYTAYLKAHYPTEFMAALMTSELGNQDKLLKYVAACKDMGIEVLPPDVNSSRREFTVKDGKIIFGLGAVKNVGDEAIREIVDAREAEGHFESVLNMLTRVNIRKLTKRVLEYLIKSGAMDTFSFAVEGEPRCTRQGMYEALDNVVSRAQKKAKEKDSGQMSLFAMAPQQEPAAVPGLGFDCEEQDMVEWPDDVKSGFEKDALGFFLTSHPLMPYRAEIRRLGLQTLEQAANMGPGQELRVAVLVTGRKEHITKKGDKMAFCDVADLTSSGELTMFPEVYAEAKPLMDMDKPLLATAHISEHDGGPQNNGGANGDEEGPKKAKLLADKVSLLAEALANSTEPVHRDVPARCLENGGAVKLQKLIEEHSGPVPVRLTLRYDDAWISLELGPNFTVQPSPEFDKAFDSWREETLQAAVLG